MAHNLTEPDDTYIPPELVGVTNITPELFEQVRRKYRNLRLELTSTGELVARPPTDVEIGMLKQLTDQLMAWTRKDATGVCFGNTAGFTLPNNAIRSPDASWVRGERWDSLSRRQKQHFPSICPDFVAELRSHTDKFPEFGKMAEYVASGAKLGWLIDPSLRRVYVYRPDEVVELLENPATVSGEPLLPGFRLNLNELWKR